VAVIYGLDTRCLTRFSRRWFRCLSVCA